MPFFTPLNIFNSYLVREFYIRNIDNKIIKDVFKDTFPFINFLKSLPKK